MHNCRTVSETRSSPGSQHAVTLDLSSPTFWCRARCDFVSSRAAATSAEGGNAAAARAEEALRGRRLPARSRIYFPGRQGGFPGRCVCGARSGLGLRRLRERVWRRDGASLAAAMTSKYGAPAGPAPLPGVPDGCRVRGAFCGLRWPRGPPPSEAWTCTEGQGVSLFPASVP